MCQLSVKLLFENVTPQLLCSIFPALKVPKCMNHPMSVFTFLHSLTLTYSRAIADQMRPSLHVVVASHLCSTRRGHGAPGGLVSGNYIAISFCLDFLIFSFDGLREDLRQVLPVCSEIKYVVIVIVIVILFLFLV